MAVFGVVRFVLVGGFQSKKMPPRSGTSRGSLTGCRTIQSVFWEFCRRLGLPAAELQVFSRNPGFDAFGVLQGAPLALHIVVGQANVNVDFLPGNNVTDAFLSYVRPLIGSGFHTPARIRAPRVEQIGE